MDVYLDVPVTYSGQVVLISLDVHFIFVMSHHQQRHIMSASCEVFIVCNNPGYILK